MNEIFTTVLIGKNYLEIVSNTMHDDELICLYDKKKIISINEENFLLCSEFVKNSLYEIEAKTKNSIKKINLIFDDYSLSQNLLNIESKIIKKHSVYKKTKELKKQDFYNFQSSIRNEWNNENSKLISIVPLVFKSFNQFTKKYETHTKFPYKKELTEIECHFLATSIDKSFFNEISKIFDSINVNFNYIQILSNLSFYDFRGQLNDKLTFTLNIENEKSSLLTCLNKVVTSNQKLAFSFNDLVEKVSKDFNIPIDTSKNIILNYGEIDVNGSKKCSKEIVYLSQDNSKFVTKYELQKYIKSFLKSITTEAKKMIDEKYGDNEYDYDINIVGKLEKTKNIDIYCVKYFERKNVVANNTEIREIEFNWNNSFKVNYNLIKFVKIIENKINFDEQLQNKQIRQNNIINRKQTQLRLIKENPKFYNLNKYIKL